MWENTLAKIESGEMNPDTFRKGIEVRVDGGAERHESVQNGLAALLYTPEFVAVHDGARPLITACLLYTS